MNIQVASIMQPNEAISDLKKALLEVYKESYGEEYAFLINNRMNNFTYIFDSNPIETMAFILEEYDTINDKRLINFYEDEYYDYCRKKNKIERKSNLSLAKYIAHFLGINYNRKLYSELLDLDISSFNYENCNIVNNPESSPELKEEVLKRQKAYLKKCQELGINPLTNSTYINIIEQEKAKTKEMVNIYLLKNTKWGKRIIKKIHSLNHYISIEDINRILSIKKTASTSHVLGDDRKSFAGIMYFPIIHNLNIKSIDRVFLHENRHVIESSNNSCGVHPHVGRKYLLINELHTEDNALQDAGKIPCIWSNSSFADESYSVYEEMLPYTFDFFTKNRDLINYYAICGNIKEFEERFGQDKLLELEEYLVRLKKHLKDTHFKEPSEEELAEGLQLVKSLNCQ